MPKKFPFFCKFFCNLELLPLSLFQLGESLVQKRHIASDEIRQVVTRLMSKWNELLKASEDRGKGLGEVKDILEFNEQVDKVLDWIREKVWSKH